MDPLVECSMRGSGTPAMSQWGRETVYAGNTLESFQVNGALLPTGLTLIPAFVGKERAITPSPDGLVLPSLNELAPPSSRQFLEEVRPAQVNCLAASLAMLKLDCHSTFPWPS